MSYTLSLLPVCSTRMRLLVLLALFFCFGCPDQSETLDALTIPDAGRDAGADAGMNDEPDGAEPDAEPDASEADASEGDASEVDAGQDAGDEDANQADAAPEDAGKPCTIATTATTTAVLRVTADDVRRVFVNGTVIEEPEFPARWWGAPSTHTITIFAHPARENTVAIQVNNLFNTSGYDRAALVEITTNPTATTTSQIVTDATTPISTSSVAGWTDPGFDDSAWQAPFDLGLHGIGPWGAVLGASNAHWIWTYDPSGDAASKPVMESAFLRLDFYVLPSGALSPAPGTCP